MHSFYGETANELWSNAYSALNSTQPRFEQNSRSGNTNELLHAHLELTCPTERWVSYRIPAINPGFSIAETFWLLSGRNDAEFLNRWYPDLPTFQGNTSIYPGAYGKRIRSHFGIDQLDRAYKALRENPDSRQVVIQIWDTSLDFPLPDGSAANEDIPCNVCSIPKVRQGHLEWMQIMRSNDIFRGLPCNLVQFTTVQEILAGWLGLKLGAYHHISDSLHLYTADQSSSSIATDIILPPNNDSLAVSKPDFDEILTELMQIFDKLVQSRMSADLCNTLISTSSLPLAYQNLLLIAAAEIARRDNCIDEAGILAENCQNQQLKKLWNNWRLRNSGTPPAN